MGEMTPEDWAQTWQQYLQQDWPNPLGNKLTHVEDRRAGIPAPPVVNQTHFFDANGNLTREKQSRHFEWDHSDHLREFRTQAPNGPATVRAVYLYDAAGMRVKKLVVKGHQAGVVETTTYIDEVFEHHQRVQAGATKENSWLHVMDGESRVALVRVGSPLDVKDVGPAVQYCLGDHLGSSNLVVDEKRNWVNREEFTPYGETSFGGFGKKRYRFTGKERDEESGLSYHSSRYYSSWLGKWMSVDKLGILGGLNSYSFANNNPLIFIDPLGTNSSSPPNSNTPGGSTDYKSQDIKASGNTDWSKERAKHTSRKNNISGVNRQGGVYQEHHHADIKEARKVGLNPDIAGETSRMSTVHSRRSNEVYGEVNSKKLTHHNTAKHLDKVAQNRINPATGKAVGSTPQGMIDASAESKWRWPATADYSERAKQDWTKKVAMGSGKPAGKFAAPGSATTGVGKGAVPGTVRVGAMAGVGAAAVGATASLIYIAGGKTKQEKMKRTAKVAAGTAITVAATRMGYASAALTLEGCGPPTPEQSRRSDEKALANLKAGYLNFKAQFLTFTLPFLAPSAWREWHEHIVQMAKKGQLF
jgi:RHS repeat-associated protein